MLAENSSLNKKLLAALLSFLTLSIGGSLLTSCEAFSGEQEQEQNRVEDDEQEDEEQEDEEQEEDN
jgi:hypothetical protein